MMRFLIYIASILLIIFNIHAEELIPVKSQYVINNGDDYALPEGTPIPAVKDGVVIKSGWQNPKDHDYGYGQRVQIRHGDEGSEGTTYTEYGHMKEGSIRVKKNTVIKQGDTIGEVGNTGSSTGNHLHFTERDENYNIHEPSEENREYLYEYYNE